MMLAQQGSISSAIEENGTIAAEYKYDGNTVPVPPERGRGETLFTEARRRDECPAGRDRLLTGYRAGRDPRRRGHRDQDGRPMPFQTVLRRFRRKHDVTEASEGVEMVPNVFDILYLDGETLIDLPFAERRKLLEKVVTTHIAPQVVSGSEEEIQKIYQAALDAGHEGIMIKVLYLALHTRAAGKELDQDQTCSGHPRSCRDRCGMGRGETCPLFWNVPPCMPGRGELIPLSKVATGFSDEQLAEAYDLLHDRIISRSGKEVRFEPELVFEVGYSELQISPNYPAGFALRFPRFIRIRDDKDTTEIETLRQHQGTLPAAAKQLEVCFHPLQVRTVRSHTLFQALKSKIVFWVCISGRSGPMVFPAREPGHLACNVHSLCNGFTGDTGLFHRIPRRFPDYPRPERCPVIG